MNRTQVYLDPEQRKVIKHIAVDKDTTMSDLIRKAIDNYILDQSILNETDTYVTKEYNWYLVNKRNNKTQSEVEVTKELLEKRRVAREVK